MFKLVLSIIASISSDAIGWDDLVAKSLAAQIWGQNEALKPKHIQFEIRSMRTERVGSNSGGEVARFFFLEVAENTDLKGKTDVGNMQFQATFPS